MSWPCRVGWLEAEWSIQEMEVYGVPRSGSRDSDTRDDGAVPARRCQRRSVLGVDWIVSLGTATKIRSARVIQRVA